MDKWQWNIENQIMEAQRQGKFDNLPGHGKPLDLLENPFEDPAIRMAHRLLKDNGFTLPWIEAGKQIDLDLEKTLKKLTNAWDWYTALGQQPVDAAALEKWEQAKAGFLEEVQRINKRIKAFNLQIPLSQFEKKFVDGAALLGSLTGKGG